MNQHTLSMILAAALGAGGTGCGQSGSKTAPMPGTFKGAYLGCSETINLNSDGSFTQTLAFANGAYTNSGSWNFETRRMQPKVVFSRFLVAVDTSVNPPKPLNPPKEYSFYDGDWILSSERIEFRPEAHYFVQRVSK
jgi:hypothetical protein